jgi:hypothetical protein
VDTAGCVGPCAALSTADGRSLVRRSYLRIQALTWHPLGSGGSLRLGAPCVGATIYRARRCLRARIGGCGAAPTGRAAPVSNAGTHRCARGRGGRRHVQPHRRADVRPYSPAAPSAWIHIDRCLNICV